MAKRAGLTLKPEKFLYSLKQYTVAAVKEMRAEAVQIGEEIMADSKEHYVPVRTGALRASGNVQIEKQDRNFTVVMGFGGVASEYAVVVHEDMTAHHTVGSAKYLETPYRKGTSDFADRLKAAAKRAANATR